MRPNLRLISAVTLAISIDISRRVDRRSEEIGANASFRVELVQFDHAVRDRGADERGASSVDPNEWIDVMSKILRPGSLPEHWRVCQS
jgi:hypothetical protein